MPAKSYKGMIYFPNLDALRFFCFLSVFFFHSFSTKYESISGNNYYRFVEHGIFGNGNLGVNFFFVLSGFLITYLLLVEKENLGKIDIKKFYMRRVLRIWPLFYFCVFFGFIVFPFLKVYFSGLPSTETARPSFYLFFINNFDIFKNGSPDSSVLAILWSVAIEEQFYLFWPLIVAFFSKRILPYSFLAIIVASFVFRWSNVDNELMLERHTLSCISDLAIGGFGAYAIFYSTAFKARIEKLPKSFILSIYVLSVACFFFRTEIFQNGSFLKSFDRLAISILFLLIILEQNFSQRSLFKLAALRRVSKLGQYTYGLYCLHMVAILVVATLLTKLGWNKSLWQVLVLETSLGICLTIGLAYFSYHLYEKRFLKLKSRFSTLKTKPIVLQKEKEALIA